MLEPQLPVRRATEIGRRLPQKNSRCSKLTLPSDNLFSRDVVERANTLKFCFCDELLFINGKSRDLSSGLDLFSFSTLISSLLMSMFMMPSL